MESLVRQSLVDNILEIEGGFTLDAGNPTYKGISTGTYPHLAEQIMNSALPDERIRQIYLTDYLDAIPGASWLEEYMPGVLWLLFSGKVHGSGDEEYTSFIQHRLNELGHQLNVDGILGSKTLRALQSTNAKERHLILSSILDNASEFVSKRQRSVGRLPDGIRNRVLKELNIARNFGIKHGSTTVVKQTDFEWDQVVTPRYEFGLRRS